MNKEELQRLFRQKYQFDNWKHIFNQLFRKVDWLATPQYLFENIDSVKKGFQFGSVALDDGKKLALFVVEVADSVNIVSNRVGLRGIAAKYIDQYITHGALVLYYSPTDKDYRFSFIAKHSEFDEDGNFTKTETQPKRFTYVLGENESCRTAAERFEDLFQKNKSLIIKDFIDAFSVEKLSKDFFASYRNTYYSNFIAFLTGENADGKKIEEPHAYLNTVFKGDKKNARNFVKKLLGRLVFMHFLQKKGWLGCPKGRNNWEDGDPAFLQNLFKNCTDKEHFLTHSLNELFFNTLNIDRKNTDYIFALTGTRVPYLNGGLFDNDSESTNIIDFPSNYWHTNDRKGLLDFFEQYNFTIDENDYEEQEVGIDPEMLGHIFENLLEDNKGNGTFYTPKGIVQYMCQESLIQYLKTHLDTTTGISDNIEQFVRNRSVSEALAEKEMARKINRLLNDVKICDPAIGSGAFPIGLLQNIFRLRECLYKILNPDGPEFPRAKVKKEIIQNSIYGVDKDGGAVDIARLRFWLALIVDEKEPEPLPNLDYKIMQGDSLIEWFEGVSLSNIARRSNTMQIKVVNPQFDIFTGQVKNAQTEMTFLNTEGGDIFDLLDQYFESTGKQKTSLHEQIDQAVLEHIRFNLREHEVGLQEQVLNLRRNLDAKIKSLSNPLQREKLRNESNDALKIRTLETQLAESNTKFERLKDLNNKAERPFFLWHLYFKEVLDNGGFDIVIANPPYLTGSKLKDFKDYFKSNFKTAQYQLDLYVFFIEKGTNLLKKDGVITFITPNSWLKNMMMSECRRFILENLSLKIICPNIAKAFTAQVDTSIFIASKNNKPDFIKIVNFSLNQIDVTKTVEQKRFWNNEKLIFDVEVDDKIGKILKIIRTESIDLYSICDISFGFRAYDLYAGQSKEIITSKPYTSNIKMSDNFEPYIVGKNIEKYSYKIDDKHFIMWGDWLAAPREEKYFTGERIVLREILGKTFVCTFISENLKIDRSLYIAKPKNNEYSAKYILAILGSKCLSWSFRYEKNEFDDLFPKIRLEEFKKLPIKKVEKTVQDTFGVLIDYLLYLKKYYQITSTPEVLLMSDYFEQLIDGLVYELYFTESIKAAGRDIFKYLPILPSLLIGGEINIIRAVFEKIHAKEHPIRSNLFYITSVEEVRVITDSLKSK